MKPLPSGGGCSLNDYPEYIYSQNGARYYGDQSDEYSDNLSLNIIKSAKDKPNKAIRIYRAIPDLNKDINKKIKELNDILYYYDKFNFFPRKNKIMSDLYDEYDYTKYEYEEYNNLLLSKIREKIKNLNDQKFDRIKINNGDWVTINIDYAKAHGKNNLNNKYKIITKIVKASELYTDGNSIHEWGYNI